MESGAGTVSAPRPFAETRAARTAAPIEHARAMKVGIVGVGKVGCACALAMVGRGSAREIVLVDRTRRRAEAVATDLRYGLPLSRRARMSAGDYDALAGAAL